MAGAVARSIQASARLRRPGARRRLGRRACDGGRTVQTGQAAAGLSGESGTMRRYGGGTGVPVGHAAGRAPHGDDLAVRMPTNREGGASDNLAVLEPMGKEQR